MVARGKGLGWERNRWGRLRGMNRWRKSGNRLGKNGNSADFIYLGSKITADRDGNYEIKRCLLLGRKAMTNLDRTLKGTDITLLMKGP